MTAQLQPIDLVAPGFLGLNLSQASNILSPRFATKAQNCVLDSSGRLAAREGYTIQTTTPVTPAVDIETIFEYRQGDGSVSLIVAWDGGIANDISNPEGNDISGAVVDTDGRWWFQNFNEKVIGFQHGKEPIVYTGTGSFATVVESSGTTVTSHQGIGLCAYGRVWAVDSDGQTIKYSGLLDETDWGGAGAGSIDMSNIWTGGMDEITALVAYNATIVVFGHNHIVFIGDGQGSSIGVDPNNLYVVDIIEGTGCESQWSIQHIGESELYFVSRNGIQSLQRVVQEKSNPITTVTKNVRSALTEELRGASQNAISSFYSPKLGIYGITFPAAGTTWVLDPRYPYQDQAGETVVPVTTWTLAPAHWCVRNNDDILLGVSQEVGLYGGTSDDGSSYRFIYQSPWLDLGEQLANRLKILKRIGSILFVENDASILFKWAVDFNSNFDSISKTVSGAEGGAEWGVAEWGLDEFSQGLSLRIVRINARDTGQYFRLGIEGDITGTFALQQLELFAKIGRLA